MSTDSAAGSSSATTVDDRLRRLQVVPVVVIRNAERAVPMASALADGGLPCAEITFRTADAPEALRRIAAELPDVFVGAGTVLSPEKAALARECGAKFIVSPGFNPRVVGYCQEHGIPVYPGVCTPTEIEAAFEKGLKVLKFFPAEPMGGAKFLSAISAPFPDLKFIPTGGIGLEQLPSYLRLPSVLACGGSWMAPGAAIDAGDFDRIRQEAERAVAAAAEARAS